MSFKKLYLKVSIIFAGTAAARISSLIYHIQINFSNDLFIRGLSKDHILFNLVLLYRFEVMFLRILSIQSVHFSIIIIEDPKDIAGLTEMDLKCQNQMINYNLYSSFVRIFQSTLLCSRSKHEFMKYVSCV